MRGGMLAGALTAVLALSGCAGGQDFRTTAPSQETQNQVEDAQTIPVTWDQTDSPMPAEFCKIPDARPEPYRGQARGHTVDGVSYGGPSGFPLVEVTVP